MDELGEGFPRRRVCMPVDHTEMTKQADAATVSVNEQLRRYRDMGLVPSAGKPPRYGDFTGVGDFHQCLLRVREAEQEFMRLPAQVRKLCENDPGVFLEQLYGGKPEVLEALRVAGLVELHKPEALQSGDARVGDGVSAPVA